jgi:hypothetical protein
LISDKINSTQNLSLFLIRQTFPLDGFLTRGINMKLPKARTENLLEQNLENETLIYDLTIDKAFNLNETLSAVYKACGQNLTFDELKRASKFTDDFIYLALDELKRENLLAEEYRSPFAQTSRREVIKKVGLATMFALPVITGLVAPKAINAASGAASGGTGDRFEACSPGGGCGVGVCKPTSRGYERCCLAPQGPGIAYYPGESSTQTFGGYFIRPTGTTSADECASSMSCCAGGDYNGGASGTCTYTSYTGDDLDDETRDQLAQSGYTAYSLSCSCTCPT